MKFLFVPCHFSGHVFSMIGLAKNLHRRGHQVLFFSHNSHVKLYQDNNLNTESYEAPNLNESDFIRAWSFLHKRSFLEFIKDYFIRIRFVVELIQITFKKDKILEHLIKEFNPDVIILDDFLCPSIICSEKPWVNFWSPNPLYFFDWYRLIAQEFENKWLIHSLRKVMEVFLKIGHKLFYFLRGYGYKYNFVELKSPYLNFYVYPQELDYNFSESDLVKTYRLDATFIQEKIESIENVFLANGLPKLAMNNNKLVLVSFGTIVFSDVDYLRKIISILPRNRHNFIVVMGKSYGLLKLSRNMFGVKYINQKQVLPFIDLLINHGGNNSFTEAFYFGKPQICIPYWTDQHDNAERLHQLKLGKRIKLEELNENLLHDAIESSLNDRVLNNRLNSISTRIQSENRLNQATKFVEDLANN